MKALRLGIAGLAVLGVGFTVGWVEKPSRLNARLYATDRLPSIQAHLDDAPNGYILLAGDSQAELQSPAQRVCGTEIVNGGISGASASVYADLVAKLSVKTRARAVVVFIGTNDLQRKKEPLSDRTAQGFDDAVERIVTRLQAGSDRVVVAAVPPISRSVEKRLEPAAVVAYSARIEALCRRLSCRYVDPYADLRDGDTGFALPGALRDALHITDYRRVMRALEPVLCAAAP
ncbi:SGNH/GDSL hydrolase family protein [Methylobacterium sp. Leaf106]|uniref:SGNH/GDSL hydrolase family protein n=1 Tax=Methylobacterium sp. Leaf106 TaxID=1736255 RepID=UPI0006FB4383|nr:GDSL-type esterase/lipase family protein [Methylobacterium sp. Leaf106]KQP42030.1 GDSL family lipase [Methylobacterium sp. Leaf106]